MRNYWIGIVLTVAIVVLAGCASANSAGDPQTGEAKVDSIDILILESFPVQVQVIARGLLPSSCTTIDGVRTEQQGNTFAVTITTVRPADAKCRRENVPFEESIPLPVAGLAAGTYTLDINGVKGTFELAIDNILPAEERAEPADDEQPVEQPTTDDLPRQPEPKPVPGLADIESIDVQQSESNPNQVKIIVQGYLRDGCTKIDEVKSAREGDAFVIAITTTRPQDAMCTQALVPFEEAIELDVQDLPAGTYSVTVNQQRATLELPLGE